MLDMEARERFDNHATAQTEASGASGRPRRRGRRRATLLDAAAIALALAGLASGYALWRLSVGTLPIGLAAPVAEAALERLLDGEDVEIGSLRLGWDADRRAFVLLAGRISARSPNRPQLLRLGQMDLTLDPGALLRGKALVREISVSGIEAALVVDAQGRSAFGFGSAEEVQKLPRAAARPGGFRRFVEEAKAALAAGGPAAALESVRVAGSRLVVLDPDSGRALVLTGARARMNRTAGGHLTLEIATDAGGGGAIGARMSLPPGAAQALSAELSVAGFNPSGWPQSLAGGQSAALDRVDVPVTLDLALRLDPEGAVRTAQGRVQLGQGCVDGVAVRAAQADVSLDMQGRTADFQAISASGPGVDIRSGRVRAGWTDAAVSRLEWTAARLRLSAPGRLDLDGGSLSGQARFAGGDIWPAEAALTADTLRVSRPGLGAWQAAGLDARWRRFGAGRTDVAFKARTVSGRLEDGRPAQGGDIALQASLVGNGVERAQGAVGRFALGAAGGRPGGSAANARFSLAAGGLLNLGAARLGLVAGGYDLSLFDVRVAGRRTPRGLADAEIVAARVDARNPVELERPLAAANLFFSGDILVGRDGAGARIAALGVDLAGAHVRARGRAWRPGPGSPRLEGELEVDGEVAMRDLFAVWPRHILSLTRADLEPLLRGGYGRAIGPIRLDVPAGLMRGDPAPDSAVSAEIEMRDGIIAYVDGLTPLTEAAGIARISGNSLSVDLWSGWVGPLRVAQGWLDAPRLHPKGQIARVNVRVLGDAGDMAREIDLPPLRLLSNAGLDPARIGGTGVAELNLRVPLIRGMPRDAVRVDVDAAITGASLRDVFGGQDVTEGLVTVEVRDNQPRVHGSARFWGASFGFDWRADAAGGPARLVAEGVGQASALAEAGFDLNGWVDGPLRARVTAETTSAAFAGARIEVDARDARIELPGGLWRKPAGEPASLVATVDPMDGGGFLLRDIALDGPGARARGSVQLDRDGRLAALQASQLQVDGRMDLSLDARAGPSGLIIAVGGRFVDLGPLLGRRDVSARTFDLLDQPMRVSARVGQMVTGEGEGLRDVTAELERDAAGWLRIDLTGLSAAGRSVVSMQPAPDGRRVVSGTLSDAGFFARLLYPGAPIYGGSGSIDGELPVVGVRSAGALSVQARDIVLRRNGQDIAFATVNLPMRVDGGVVTLRDGRADGPGLSVQAGGYVNLETGYMDLRGSAAPGGLNRALGALPVFGLLMGGPEPTAGLLGITFQAKGPLSDPRLTVNPISALAPGIFRRLFAVPPPLSPSPRFVTPPLRLDAPRIGPLYGPPED